MNCFIYYECKKSLMENVLYVLMLYWILDYGSMSRVGKRYRLASPRNLGEASFRRGQSIARRYFIASPWYHIAYAIARRAASWILGRLAQILGDKWPRLGFLSRLRFFQIFRLVQPRLGFTKNSPSLAQSSRRGQARRNYNIFRLNFPL